MSKSSTRIGRCLTEIADGARTTEAVAAVGLALGRICIRIVGHDLNVEGFPSRQAEHGPTRLDGFNLWGQHVLDPVDGLKPLGQPMLRPPDGLQLPFLSAVS